MANEEDIEEIKAVRDDWCNQYTEVRDENAVLKAALREIANDPTGISSHQAEIAQRALDGNYLPFVPPNA